MEEDLPKEHEQPASSAQQVSGQAMGPCLLM